jgi:hypothetical protein
VKRARAVVVRYPLAVKILLTAPCILLIGMMVKDHIHPMVVAGLLGAICLNVHVLAYRIEIDKDEVRARYLPFHTVRTPMRTITHLIEDRTLVFATAASKIPLWGLSRRERLALIKMLPSYLDYLPERRVTQPDPQMSLRIHKRRAIFAGLSLATSLALLVPFLNSNPWNKYAQVWGGYLLYLCFGSLLWFMWECALVYIYWTYLRSVRKAARDGQD